LIHTTAQHETATADKPSLRRIAKQLCVSAGYLSKVATRGGLWHDENGLRFIIQEEVSAWMETNLHRRRRRSEAVAEPTIFPDSQPASTPPEPTPSPVPRTASELSADAVRPVLRLIFSRLENELSAWLTSEPAPTAVNDD